MQYWLVKSEPFKYSWDQFCADEQTCWDGVRNYQARNNLKAMKTGDQVFFYHSNEGLSIVGIAMVIKEAYPEPGADHAAWVAVDLAPLKALSRPVSLSVLKQDPLTNNMSFIRQGRLSVSPVTSDEWNAILKMTE